MKNDIKTSCKYALCLYFILILIYKANAGNTFSEQSLNGDFIKEWLVVGPFYPADLDSDFLVSAGGERKVIPAAGDTVFTATGDTLFWNLFKTNQSAINLRNAIGDYKNAAGYAFCTIKSPVDRKIEFQFGSDDGAAIWINGGRVHYNPAPRPLFLDQDRFEAELKSGVNTCLIKISQNLGEWGFALRSMPDETTENIVPRFYLSADILKSAAYLPVTFWNYHTGDRPEWANPQFDDSAWEKAGTMLNPGSPAVRDWRGTGWFRLHIAVDSAVIGKPIGLRVWQAGNAHIYLDGQLIDSLDIEVEQESAVPEIFTFKQKEAHVLAVRYAIDSIPEKSRGAIIPGFNIRLGNPRQMASESVQQEKKFGRYQVIFTTLSLAIGLLHLILFLFSPRLKQNLYFALFLFAYAAAVYFDYQQLLETDFTGIYAFMKYHRIIWPILLILQLRFVYSLFYTDISKQLWQFSIFVLVAVGLSIVAVFDPVKSFEYIDILFMAVVVEISRVIIVGFLRKREGTWIIALAFFVFFCFLILDYFMDAGFGVPFSEMRNPYAFGIIPFFLAMSVYLSRDFSRTTKKLAEQQTRRKLLEAENERKTKELEEARQLQLSMLPKDIPRHPRLDIAVYMKTATEVGGDYYDFKQHDDGMLTLAIGDATGHSMRAGTMVSATKSLFHALAAKTNPAEFLKQGTKAVKAMGLKKIFMALTIARFQDHQMQIAAAGMPFPIIFRSATNKMEDIELKGMPLGGFDHFPYKEKTVQLRAGDVILFTSDGFEELFNPDNEMLGIDRVKSLFAECARTTPQNIIQHLIRAGKSWAEGREQEDDVTFVVVKIK